MEVVIVPALKDNYGWLLHCKATGATASVDTPEAGPLLKELQNQGWKLSHILNTHHHWDHTGGNDELMKAFPECVVVGFAGDAERIPQIKHKVVEGDTITVGKLTAKVIETPGHTTGHICYFFEGERALFSGDTLFSMGCGRLFEGNPSMMWKSLSKLMALPGETAVYCAHEYTEANAKFAVTIDPQNKDLAMRCAEVKKLRADGRPTIPSTIALELATNPFLRANNAPVRKQLGFDPSTPDVAVFTEIRKRKDNF
ncbi:Hydroxyacylglutathione hydrolase [Diplonema papillatum]|nr:Hydroxyacylglutathione hydrolase [Diplonema papillatum]